jgi:serine/threonine protein kinase
MFTDYEPSLASENPFTGNDRFVIYEDGGRPMDILLTQFNWRPTVEIVKRIAGQLLEVLAYLFSKRVVHRRLELGSVVFSLDTHDVKLISLGEAKYIEPLDYENRVTDFEREWLGARAQAGGKGPSHHHPRTDSPPPKPHPDLSLVNSITCMHPSLRCVV